MKKNEHLRSWLDGCDEWITATDLDKGSIHYLQARLKRAVNELRTRLDAEDREYSDHRDLLEMLASPPEGWYTFGTHVDQPVQLEFWGERGGLPLWERPVTVSLDR